MRKLRIVMVTGIVIALALTVSVGLASAQGIDPAVPGGPGGPGGPGTGPNFVDADGDGVCDNCGTGTGMHNGWGPGDGSGLAPHPQDGTGYGPGPNAMGSGTMGQGHRWSRGPLNNGAGLGIGGSMFVDANGNGICDYAE